MINYAKAAKTTAAHRQQSPRYQDWKPLRGIKDPNKAFREDAIKQ